MKLVDGRTLAFADLGDPAGAPVFVFPGLAGSRLEAAILESAALTVGVRLIAPDLPGCGLSEPKPSRTFSDWPEDMVQLASHLRLYEFAILGISAASPLVIACADRIADRLTAAGIVSPMAPLAGPFTGTSMAPGLSRLMLSSSRTAWTARRALERVEQQARTNVAALLDHVAAQCADVDRLILDEPQVREVLRDSLIDTFRQGSVGPGQELVLLRHSWHIAWKQVAFPVQLWHGRRDTLTPPSMAEELAALLPHTLTRWYPDGGHSILVVHAQEILHQLIGSGNVTHADATVTPRAHAPE
jgi:pimeloyl-ACP methyl ester carboxylesterase